MIMARCLLYDYLFTKVYSPLFTADQLTIVTNIILPPCKTSELTSQLIFSLDSLSYVSAIFLHIYYVYYVLYIMYIYIYVYIKH